jgi:hypothetical protein
MYRRILGYLKFVPLGVVLPMVIGAASIGPEDAVSNLSKWMDKFGIHNLPDALTTKAADHHILIATGVFSVIYAFLMWGLPAIRLGPIDKKIFGVGAAWYFWPSSKVRDKPAAPGPQVTLPPPTQVPAPNLDLPAPGTLRYDVAGIQLYHKHPEKPGPPAQTAGEIFLKLSNPTDKLMRFHATLSGSINGQRPENETLETEGYIPANDSVKILYNKVFDLNIRRTESIRQLPLVGLLDYTVSYGFDGQIPLPRTTGKSLRIEVFQYPFKGEPQPERIIPVNVLVTNEIEK